MKKSSTVCDYSIKVSYNYAGRHEFADYCAILLNVTRYSIYFLNKGL